ncbi:MAG: 6,7-dimethyl-8-ribityllumazine synthase [bacterium]|nr:6,7-dimethyl-8-ribityllumazine synthase [bacterium]
MVKEYKGELIAKGLRFGIVVSRFNEFITEKLLSGAVDTLLRHGAMEEDIEVFWVPGSFEIPYLARILAKDRKYDAIICLGTIIRGETPHFNYICSEVAKGIAQTSLSTGTPVIFGVLTTDTTEQAIERAGVKSGNKGRDAAFSAMEMVNLYRKINSL